MVLSPEEIARNELLHMLYFTLGLLEKNNITFWLTCGSLLGAVREGKIMPWDNDIDIGMWRSDASEIIKLESVIQAEYGFRLQIKQGSISAVRKRYEEWGCLEDWNPTERYSQLDIASDTTHQGCRIWYHTRHLDIRYHVINKKVAMAANWPHNRCPIEDLQNLEEIEFEGRMCPIPRNPKEFLRCNYGDDWETPKIESYMIPRLPEAILRKYKNYILPGKMNPIMMRTMYPDMYPDKTNSDRIGSVRKKNRILKREKRLRKGMLRRGDK